MEPILIIELLKRQESFTLEYNVMFFKFVHYPGQQLLFGHYRKLRRTTLGIHLLNDLVK
jgi:hypothetical protein